MDVFHYERVKFELAEILRSASARADGSNGVFAPAARELFARLAEDRFNLVVAGRFSRGKTSLMNALLDTTRLPVGMLPVTSVITTVSYGSQERMTIEYEANALPVHVPVERIGDYIKEAGNPRNECHIRFARVQLPSSLLRCGFHFVGTPGIGSTIAETTRTTLGFLSEADALLLVTSYEDPMPDDELEVARSAHVCGRRVIIVINKEDIVEEQARAAGCGYVRARAVSIGIEDPAVFSICASSGGDGVLELAHALTRLLVDDKNSHFLRSMYSRIENYLKTLPESRPEMERLASLPSTIRSMRSPGDGAPAAQSKNFSTCGICSKVAQAVVTFLASYQFELVRSASAAHDSPSSWGSAPCTSGNTTYSPDHEASVLHLQRRSNAWPSGCGIRRTQMGMR